MTCAGCGATTSTPKLLPADGRQLPFCPTCVADPKSIWLYVPSEVTRETKVPETIPGPSNS